MLLAPVSFICRMLGYHSHTDCEMAESHAVPKSGMHFMLQVLASLDESCRPGELVI